MSTQDTDAAPEEPLYFVYDGECPICQLGASSYGVRQSVGELVTVDARTEAEHPVMQDVRTAGLNLDEGMVLKYQGRLYQGDDALALMARLGADNNLLNAINNRLFRSPRVASACYPAMRLARRLALKLKGVGPLHH